MTTPEMKPPVEHELKCWPIFFQAVKRGEKTFELRSNDRNFHLDDTLWLREYRPQNGESEMPGYTGEELRVKVTYVLSSETFLQKGVVVLGFTRPTPQPSSEYVKQTDGPEISEKDILWWLKHLEEKPEEEKRAFMRIAPAVLRMALKSLSHPTPAKEPHP